MPPKKRNCIAALFYNKVVAANRIVAVSPAEIFAVVVTGVSDNAPPRQGNFFPQAMAGVDAYKCDDPTRSKIGATSRRRLGKTYFD